jgi:hypothetical protein
MNSSETSQRFKTDLFNSSDSDDDKEKEKNNNEGDVEYNLEDNDE